MIVHTHTAKAGTLGRLAVFSINFARANHRKIKTVHTFHGHVFHSYFEKFKSMAFRLIERWLAKGTDRIVVLSSSQRRDIEFKFRIATPKKICIVPLGFDLSPFKECDKYRHEIRSQILPSNDLFCLGMIGRLTAIKNNHLLLEAVAKLKRWENLKGFHFLIIGDGENAHLSSVDRISIKYGSVSCDIQIEDLEVFGDAFPDVADVIIGVIFWYCVDRSPGST